MIYDSNVKFSEVITEDVIDSWGDSDIILNGATGSGKTYWVMTKLYPYATKKFKNILFLCNRKRLSNQVLEDTKNLSIDIKTYQWLENKLKTKEGFEKDYDYIVCDEIHYMANDSKFNYYTDISFEWILQHDAQKIYMSGTGGVIFKNLIEKGFVKEEHQYTIPYDYSYATLYAYKDSKDKYGIIDYILKNSDDKIMFFANSISEAINVYKQFAEDSEIIVSDSSISKYEEIKDFKQGNIVDSKFESRLLVTTKVIDNGVNIKDTTVNHVICEVFDLISAQQCLGRPRMQSEEDTVNFYILDYNKGSLGGFKKSNNKQLIPLEIFVKDEEEYFDKYCKNRKHNNTYIYDKIVDTENGITYKKQLNILAYLSFKETETDIEDFLSSGFANVFSSRLHNIDKGFLTDMGEYIMKDDLEIYLGLNSNKKLFKKDQEQLIELIGLKDKRNRVIKSITMLNDYLIKFYDYTLTSKRVAVDGIKNTVWVVNKLN